MEEEAKAVQEVAKATGKGIDAAREFGGFISKYISGPLEQGMGIFKDRLLYMRWENQVRLMQRAQEFLKLRGLSTPTRPVPLNLAIPIMQGASLEENDDLQDRWAALLVNAADANFHGEVRRSYAAILEQLTPLDAHILDILYSIPFEESQHAGIVTRKLPKSARIAKAPPVPTTHFEPGGLPESTRITEKEEQTLPLPSEDVVISLSNLVRLGCLRPGMTWGGGEIFERVNPTVAGKAFVEACRPIKLVV